MNERKKTTDLPPAKTTEKNRLPEDGIVTKLPDEMASELYEDENVTAEKSQTRQVLASYQGPLPPPDHLFAYNRAVPDAADRIIKMAECEQSHAHDMRRWIVAIESRNSIVGLFSALLVSLVSIGGGLYVASLDSIPTQIMGGMISLTGLTSLVGAFIYGSSRRKRDWKIPNAESQNAASSTKK